mmetsp:Transcript_9763/g.14038  ORF Transcript_9763/g.14038 Transcript_9763/m.14038 type:complete len:229 (-) Transcript_9763:98-784(-)|eukprot:CAMPEP_0202458038 /NCGR_PEP_ID=MMETSP1360-20130828/20640_1 /ASSEMBLY_ACC=CAM_ASM_000848 /TAXON_ID=515479 /ORGANISM="Licmophora paradoxa, Strain CCMP2313" /LENGTH=228 /DNA_ID=CAMNT_0049078359 /DNA_START=28 /DNA_END=714 /DNA_ORIENTATION=-
MNILVSFLAFSLALFGNVHGFQNPALSRFRTSPLFQYVPDGFTPESYRKFKDQERKKADDKKKKSLGGVGPRGFKSRSMQSFQEALERGEAEHLLPVFNAEERVRRGEIKREDIPYMQRGGSWDNSDVRGAKKKRWLSSDKDYATGGFKKEQSVSIFGKGEGLDWTGSRGRTGPMSENILGAKPKFGFNYKPPNVNNMKGVKATKASKTTKKKQDEGEKKKGGFFGLF